jgi:WhiB family redox-sensing transcriptional regulator
MAMPAEYVDDEQDDPLPAYLCCETAARYPMPGPWVADAACASEPSWRFFPTRSDGLAAAREVCFRCPVRADCRDYALGVPGLHGVWGGTSDRERRRLRARPAAE